MVKGVKKVEKVKGDYTVIRVILPKRTLMEVKAKCVIKDTTVNKVIVDCLTKYVKGSQQSIKDIETKG